MLGLCGQVVIEGEGYRGGFCDKLPEASPTCDGANASSKMDPPLAKAVLISDGGNAYGSCI